MLNVLTAGQMREVDRLTTERCGIPSIDLMENAARAVARVITEKLGGSVKGKSVLILCGPGNNGGDGAALARILYEIGASVETILFGSFDRLRGDPATNFERLRAIVDARSRVEEFDPGLTFHGEFSPYDVVVDAIFGTGLSRRLDSEIAGVFKTISGSRDTFERPFLILAVDIPSGLASDDPSATGEAMRSDLTVTFTAPKAANVLPPASRFNGDLYVKEIGSPRELIDGHKSDLYLAERGDAASWLEASGFTDASYKNKRGHALIIAGSKDYTGAAVLCGDAAIRSGCGLVTIATPESSREGIVARVSPEVMVRGLSETKGGSTGEKAVDEVKEFLENVDAIAIGSGLSSKEDETRSFIRRVVEERTTPVLIDADGLTALSPFEIEGTSRLPLVLTPHEGEFRKLLGVGRDEFDEIIKDRVTAVRDFAARHTVFLVLKGERALIANPDGRVIVNPTGNSGLGKAGNGDTLTGILVGFMAQAVQMKIDLFATLVAGVYLAGMAGDAAAKKFGKRVMTASDVRECLASVFQETAK